MDLDSHRASDDTKVAAEIYIKYCKKIIDEVKKNDDIVFSEDELKCYEIIKDMLISENKNIEYLRYSRTGNYFDINIFYNFFRIKLTAKKHFIVSRYSMDELKAVIPDGNYELSPKSETGRTRIIIEDLNDILKFKGLILKSFDKSIKDVGYLKNNIKNGDYDINRYLMSNLK
ncbi:hypothetical protein [Clostridium sp. DMHC 10]|uniref:hypothetical protein n=1 Tax=Clostridium sp. DMHC 10 TaxID=747377 RepID=UPI00069DF4D1|nr:hypothetical protein [Clostridium sp. DMHC 10]